MESKAVGRTLKLIRTFHQITLAQTAERLGKNITTINLYELGDREPPLKTLNQYCKAFGIALLDLMKMIHNEEPMGEKARRIVEWGKEKMS